MKTLSIFIAGLFAVVSASAQYSRYNTNTVTVNLNGNTNEQVFIDGRNYSSGNNTFQLNLQPGQHTIQVGTNNNRTLLGSLFGSGRNNATATTFEVRNGYDTQLNVKANGRVQVRESRSTAYRNSRRNDRDRYSRNYYYNR